MTNLSQMELNSIRESVCAHITVSNKLSSYASKVNDAEIKQMFKNASAHAEESAEKLIQTL